MKSRLIYDTAIRMLEEFDENRLNKRFEPFAFYQTVQLVSMALGEKIENKKHLNKLYNRLKKFQEQGDQQKIRKIMNQINTEIDNDRAIINRFLFENKEEDYETQINQNVWQKGAIGLLSYEE